MSKFSEVMQDELVADLKAKFGSQMWVKPGYAWGFNAVLWSGEIAFMPDGLPAFDYYAEDAKETTYIMGVHKDLVKWAESKGLFWECNDPGTYLAYQA